MTAFKKWNWDSFLFVLLLAMIGASSNKSCHSVVESTILGLIIGVPLGLLFAYMGKE